MATGSPTSTLSWNRTPLVVRPSFTSRQTMRRFSSMGCRPRGRRRQVPSQARKLLRSFSPKGPDFSTWNWKATRFPRAMHDGNASAVLGHCRHHPAVHGVGIVGVHEVEARVLGDPVEDRVLPREMDGVPPHVRDLQPRPGANRGRPRGRAPGRSCRAPRSGRRSPGSRCRYPGPSARRRRTSERLPEPRPGQHRHGSRCLPDTGEDHRLGVSQVRGVAR